MMNYRRRRGRDTLENAAIVAVLGLIVLFVFYEPARTEVFWRGTSGWIEVLAPLGAFLAASVAAALAFMTFQANQRKEIAERYRAAAELLGSDRASAQTAGIKLLGTTAESAPDEYLIAATQTLAAHVASTGLQRRAVIHTSNYNEMLDPWPTEDAVETAALLAAGRLASRITPEIDRDDVRYEGRLILENAFLKDRHLFKCTFRNTHFIDVGIDNVVLEHADLRNTIFEGRVRTLTFKDCDLRGCRIFLRNRYGQTELHGALLVEGVNQLDGATIWRRPFEEFLKEGAELARLAMERGMNARAREALK